MDTAGGAVMGVGYGRGKDRADEAFKQASCSPLMEEQVIEGAKGILINITSGPDVRLLEIDQAITRHVREKADSDANVIFGVVIDPDMEEEMKVTILATGSTQMERRESKAALAQEERLAAGPSMKHHVKASLPYVEKKGFSETVDVDHEELEDIVYAEKTPVGTGSMRERSGGDSSKASLNPLSKALFTNLKKNT
jgi:cell division protein FtsZ